MIWTTAKLTEVSSPQTALPSRAAGPGTGRAAGAARRDGGDERPLRAGRDRDRRPRRVEGGREVRDEVGLVLEPDATPAAGPR